jgi:exodeoxyribonuclease VII large subunit
MTERIYLTSKYEDRAQVKALGARWDADARKWYVPSGLDLDPFAAWLPAVQSQGAMDAAAASKSESRALDAPTNGVPLSRLLGGVAALVSKAFGEGVWTTAEVLKVSSNKAGHVYLELSERNPSTGEVLAQARAVIWSRSAQALLSEFRRVTGADLDAGIKVLLRAKPVFKAQFGFSLEVDGIDPAYTLGDLEARRRDVRDRLKREGLFDRNRSLPAPWDFNAVLVVAPERAAGLGDFAKEAQRLQAHGVCEFSYIHSRFQGEGAAGEIAEAIRGGLRTWSGAFLPDAVVIIRGGGSVSDLAWLNDYALAKCICECPVPVLCGIGHERDDTSVDEVAHRKFDTPSKVILGIEDVIRARSRETRAFYDAILDRARRAASATSVDVMQLRREVEHLAKAVVTQARADSNIAFSTLRNEAAKTLQTARGAVREDIAAVRSGVRARVLGAKQAVPTFMADIDTRARSSVVLAKERSVVLLPLVLERASTTARAARLNTEQAIRETLSTSTKVAQLKKSVEGLLPSVLQHAASQSRAARLNSDRAMQEAAERASRSLTTAAERSQALFREIAGQGPLKTLRRGFAVVRTTSGKAVTAAASVEQGATIHVDLHDGTVSAVVNAIIESKERGA